MFIDPATTNTMDNNKTLKNINFVMVCTEQTINKNPSMFYYDE